MQSISIVLTILLTIIAVWDFKFLKIPNGFIISGVLLGFSLNAYNNDIYTVLGQFLWLSLLFILLFIFWSILEFLNTPLIGAGDIKLIVMLGAFIPWNEALSIFFLSIFIGSFVFMIILPPREIKRMFDEWVFQIFYHFPIYKSSNPKRIPFAVPVLLSFIVYQFNVLPIFYG